MITRRVLLQAILATCLSGLCCHATSTLYDNSTTIPIGGYAFLGATDVNGDLTTNIDLNEMTLAHSAGLEITSLYFEAVYSTPISGGYVYARPVWYFWAPDGPGGDPGTLLGQFFESYLYPFSTDPGINYGTTNLAYTLSTPVVVPAGGKIWVGISLDNDYGASAITAAQLNNIGGYTFYPPTIGQGSLEAFSVAPGAPLTDPTITKFAIGNQGNFGYTILGSPVPTPEPGTFGLMLLGVPAAAFVRRRRKTS